jgi:hypothetical protein
MGWEFDEVRQGRNTESSNVNKLKWLLGQYVDRTGSEIMSDNWKLD